MGTLDKIITKAMGFAFAFITLSIVAGSTWAFIESGTRWIGDAKIAISMITWGFYLVMIFLRTSAGWRGRKAAILVTYGGMLFGSYMGCTHRPASLADAMKFSLTGVNHKTAPIEVRERLSFEQNALPVRAGRIEALLRRDGSNDFIHLQSG